MLAPLLPGGWRPPPEEGSSDQAETISLPGQHRPLGCVPWSCVAIVPILLSLATLLSVPGSFAAPAQTAPPSSSSRPARPATGASFDVLSKQAHAAREAGRLEEAIALYRNALRLKPEWTEGRWYLGTSYYELDRYADAAAAFKRLIASVPSHGAAWGFRGLCEFQLRQYEPALVSLMKARELGIDPAQELASVVRYHTAILMTRFSQFEFAQKVLSEFTASGNDNPKILEALGLATLRVPQLPDEVDPARREQLLLAGGGTYYYYSRMTAASHGQFEELIRRYPDLPNAHYAFGVVLLNEQPDRAIDEFKEELRRSPAHVPSMLQIAFEDEALGLGGRKAVGRAGSRKRNDERAGATGAWAGAAGARRRQWGHRAAARGDCAVAGEPNPALHAGACLSQGWTGGRRRPRAARVPAARSCEAGSQGSCSARGPEARRRPRSLTNAKASMRTFGGDRHRWHGSRAIGDRPPPRY